VYTLAICLLALHGAPRAHTRAPAADRAGFVTTLGNDTVALERFERRSSRLDGDIVLRIPATVRLRYRVDLARDGRPTRTLLEQTPLGSSGIAARRVTIELAGDSARIVTDSAGRRRERVVTATGIAPVFTTGFGSSFGLYASLGLYELLLARYPLRAGDTVRVPTIGIASGRVAPLPFVRRSDTTVDVSYFQIAWTHLTVDAERRIVHVDARETTEQTISRRVDDVDIDRLASEFAARDRDGHGLGVGSPDDTMHAALGTAAVRVTYGRPRQRGRVLLGGVIPYDQVWRTGANAATVLALDHDALVGGVKLPAGEYSLWTLPTRAGVTLIINGEHGQWGTTYHQSADVARVPMQASAADAPVEQFTIDVPQGGDSPRLRIRWGTFVWTVPVSTLP